MGLVKTRFERQQQLCRIDRWFREFHENAPLLFGTMCAGVAILLFSVALLLVDLVGHLAKR